MAETRFNSDAARLEKRCQQATYAGRWTLNVPGNVPKDTTTGTPLFVMDPHWIPQKYGANVCRNMIDVDSALRGVSNGPWQRDHPVLNARAMPVHHALPVSFVYETLTDESRASCPAFQFRNAAQPHWEFPLEDPQKEGVFAPFAQNICSRIDEKQQAIARMILPETYSVQPTPAKQR